MSDVLDVHCKPCTRPDWLGPRMARFSREQPGGPLTFVRGRLMETGEQWHVYDTQAPEPHSHTPKDGGRTWYLPCGRCGHERRVREEQLAAAMDALSPDGAGNTRRVFL